MTKVRCRFGIRLPFFKNAAIIVFYSPFDVAARVSEAITLIRNNADGDVSKIVWEVN